MVVTDALPVLQHVVAKELRSRCLDAIDRRGQFVLALSGGSVASAFLPVIATLDVDWTRVHVFWIDERAVPPDHSDSNYRLAAILLVEPARIPQSHVHRLLGELADLEQAARTAVHELQSVAGNPPRLDLALVGVGEDGHVASIFDLSFPSSPPVIAVYDSPKPPPRRLTMTLPLLADARQVIVAGFGPAKAEVIRHALDDAHARTPVAELLRRASSAMVLLDRPSSH